MKPSEVESYLNTFVNFESQLHRLRPEDFSLNRIQKLLDLAGNPAGNLRIIHVAGTKGKGSTCAFLASILQEAGYKVGLYTSPHLHKVNERIRILDTDNIHCEDKFSGAIDNYDLAGILAYLRPFAAAIQNEGSIITYFEILTVAALCYFARSKVEAAILEVGLGGRLDATNAADSCVAVITPVSLDHTRILGTTLSKIASEKAGIIKNSHQKVVIAPQEKEAMDVILNRCREFGIHPVLVSMENDGNFPTPATARSGSRDPSETNAGIKIGLKGRHQMINAATATEAAGLLKTMGFKISDEAMSRGLKNVLWPGRFELLMSNPDVVVDGAHNAASAQALGQTLTQVYPHRRVILVMGISQDKDVAAVCRSLKKNVAHVFLTRARHPRAHLFTQAEGKDYFGGIPFEIIGSLPKALEKALQTAGPRDVVLVTGSMFIVAEATDYLCTNTKD